MAPIKVVCILVWTTILLLLLVVVNAKNVNNNNNNNNDHNQKNHNGDHQHDYNHYLPLSRLELLSSNAINLSLNDIEKCLDTITSKAGLTIHELCGSYSYDDDDDDDARELLSTERNNNNNNNNNNAKSTTNDLEDTKSDNVEEEEKSESDESKSNPLQNTIGAFICIIVAALAAGLTMGLLNQDLLDLTIKEMAAATTLERQQAASLIPLIQDHHRLVSIKVLLLLVLLSRMLCYF